MKLSGYTPKWVETHGLFLFRDGFAARRKKVFLLIGASVGWRLPASLSAEQGPGEPQGFVLSPSASCNQTNQGLAVGAAGPGEGVGAGTGCRLLSQLAPASPKTRDCLKPRVVSWQQLRWRFPSVLLAGGLRSAAVPGDSFDSYLKNKNKSRGGNVISFSAP